MTLHRVIMLKYLLIQAAASPVFLSASGRVFRRVVAGEAFLKGRIKRNAERIEVKVVMYMKQFLLIAAMYGLGHIVSVGLGLPLPANVLGLLFLFLALCLKVIKLSDVETVADFIISHLALFFVVPTVGIMLYFDLLGRSFLQIFVPLLTAAVAGFFVTGHVTQMVIRRMAAARLSQGKKREAGGEIPGRERGNGAGGEGEAKESGGADRSDAGGSCGNAGDGEARITGSCGNAEDGEARITGSSGNAGDGEAQITGNCGIRDAEEAWGKGGDVKCRTK